MAVEKVSGRKRIGMFDKFMGKERHGDLKRRAEDRKNGKFGCQEPALRQKAEKVDCLFVCWDI